MIASSEDLPPGWRLHRERATIMIETPPDADGCCQYVVVHSGAVRDTTSRLSFVLHALADAVLNGERASRPNPLAQLLEFEQTRLSLEKERTEKLVKLLASLRPALVLFGQQAGVDADVGRQALENLDKIVLKGMS